MVRDRVWADIPFLAVVRCQAVSNQVVSGVRVRLEDRSCGHARLVTARTAHEAAPGRPPWLAQGAARRAEETVRPAETLDVAQTRLVVREHLDETPVGVRVVLARDEPLSHGGTIS